MHSNLQLLGRMRVNDAPIVAFNGFMIPCEAGLVTMHVHKHAPITDVIESGDRD